MKWTELTHDDLTSRLMSFLKTSGPAIQSTATACAYQGFSAEAVFLNLMNKMDKQKVSERQRSYDVWFLLITFLVRGPNLAKVKAETLKGGSDAYIKISTLQQKYDIKSTKPGPTDITLPRLSMIFAQITQMIYTKIKDRIVNFPVSIVEIGIQSSQELSFNFVPCLLGFASLSTNYKTGLVFSIHNIYQSILAKKVTIRDRKDAPMYFPNATKYAKLACSGTLASGITITSMETHYTDVLDNEIGIENAIEGIKSFFQILPKDMCDEVTQVHYIVNYCMNHGKNIRDIDNAMFMQPLNIMKSRLT